MIVSTSRQTDRTVSLSLSPKKREEEELRLLLLVSQDIRSDIYLVSQHARGRE